MILQHAEEWYQAEMEKLIDLRESSTMSDIDYDTGVNKLMSLPVLREELCSWHARMLEDLSKKDQNGQTLVRRAFNNEGKWGLCFQQSFQATAAARRDAVRAEEQAVLSEAVIAARLDPAGAAGFAPADIPPSLQVNNVMVAPKVLKKTAVAAEKAARTDFVGDQTERTLLRLQEEKASGLVTSYGDGGAKDRDAMSSFTQWTMIHQRSLFGPANTWQFDLQGHCNPTTTLQFRLPFQEATSLPSCPKFHFSRTIYPH